MIIDDILKVYKIIKDNTDNDTEVQINGELSLKNLYIDSISFVKIIIALENEFNIEFDDEALNLFQFNTIQDVIDYISIRLRIV